MAKLKITQTRSIIREPAPTKKTMEALGLRKLHQSVEHEDTPQIRGMLSRVRHLTVVEEMK